MIRTLIRKPYILLLIAGLCLAEVGCSRSNCPANNSGYMDSHKFVKKQKNKKPQSGLFEKGKSKKKHGF